MYKRVIFGDVANPNVAKLTDIDAREFTILAALAGAVLLFGIWIPDVYQGAPTAVTLFIGTAPKVSLRLRSPSACWSTACLRWSRTGVGC